MPCERGGIYKHTKYFTFSESKTVRLLSENFVLNGSTIDRKQPMQLTPTLLGSLRPGAVVNTDEFRHDWRFRFARLSYPTENNYWLIYNWDDFTLRPLKRFPSLPQVVEGLDYFRKEQRDHKRWKVIRRIMRCCMQCIDHVHSCGYSHGAINAASLWLNTYDQQEFSKLAVTINDFGACQKLSRLNDNDARTVRIEDWYQLGFVFLELILASFAEDDSGAQVARAQFGLAVGRTAGQLTGLEIQQMFERSCDRDFQTFRQTTSSVSSWSTALALLEAQQGEAWQLIFKLLARGSLFDTQKQRPVKITGERLIRQHSVLFSDTY